MPLLGFTAAFAWDGAELPGRMWAVSAGAAGGSLVIGSRGAVDYNILRATKEFGYEPATK